MRTYALLLVGLLAVLLCGCGGGQATPEPTPTPTATAWAGPPMVIDTARSYTATIETEKGDLVLELFAADVPVTVNNFVYLASQGFYDGCTFHRVMPGFMAQAGDPTGTGAGTPGYYIPNEITEHTHVAGALSMANSGADRNGCQFFICYEAQPYLDGSYSVFGQLIEGMEVLESLTPRDPRENPDYDGDTIIRITVEES
ncbi:MAG: peptidylprolyl isomerase [Chloroflexota bacterium]|nr:peptidylprolyl isomerase [Chloroflexota bacterium]